LTRPAHYRADIDGLRAVAVALVVIYHAFPDQLPGGYIGVDVFFVISGFLITQLLLTDLRKNSFSFLGFYGRRIRRIFPALVVVLLFCLVLGWFLLTPTEFQSLGLNIVGGAGFSSNFVLLREAGYFDLTSEQKPLLHLWSLGVEEQFYIVWPAALALAFARRVSIAVVTLFVLTISFVFNVVEAGSAVDFYSSLTRAWELMFGGLLAALTLESGRERLAQIWRSIPLSPMTEPFRQVTALLAKPDLRSLGGLALIGLAAVVLNKNSQFPGWWALLPTVGTVLVISAENARINRSVLSHPVAVFVGLISYPLYLWHWPLLSFLAVIQPNPLPAVRVAAVVAAILLACLTYFIIERPIRRGQLYPAKMMGLACCMAILGFAGLSVYGSQGVPLRLPVAIRDVAQLQITPEIEKTEWRYRTCFLGTDDTKAQFIPDCLETRRPLLFLWGDSFAAAFYPGLKRLQQSLPFGLAQFTSAGCSPLLAVPVTRRPHCEETNEYVRSMVADSKPDIVLLHAAWSRGDARSVAADLATTVKALRDLQIKRVVVMGQGPYWEGGEPKAAVDYYMHDPANHRILPERSDFRTVGSEFDDQFRQQVSSLDAEYISAWAAFCEGRQCLTRVGERPEDLVAYDHAHLTVWAAAYLARTIAPCLFPAQGDYTAKTRESAGDLSAVCSTRPGKL
jgi:peptidoglycan/LPS O-acetylase OafA/YrhL